MRCGGEFACRTPGCEAKYDVLPRIVQRAPDGSVEVVEHECGKPTPPPGEQGKGADARGTHECPRCGVDTPHTHSADELALLCAACRHPLSFHSKADGGCIGSPQFPGNVLNNWEGPQHKCPPHRFVHTEAEQGKGGGEGPACGSRSQWGHVCELKAGHVGLHALGRGIIQWDRIAPAQPAEPASGGEE